MSMRPRFLITFFAVAIAATVIGCSGGNSMRSSLPPAASQLESSVAASAAAADQESPLEQAVARSHKSLTGSADYGVLEGEWVPVQPAPGKPGYDLIDGEVVPEPPDDSPPVEQQAPQSVSPGAPAPQATTSCVLFTDDVPPPCTPTGPFRRVYSAPGYSYALAQLTLPNTVKTMPTYPPLHGDTGFVYFEGWLSGSPNAGNSEFGFQYSSDHNYYTPYAKTSNPKGSFIFVINNVPIHYLPTSSLTFALAGYAIGKQDYLHMALLGTANLTCTTAANKPTHLCLSHGHVPDNGWSTSGCCIMARMTTIGQSNPYDENWFYDNVSFGPITWSGVELAKAAPSPSPGSTTLPFVSDPYWTSGGSQNWPPLLNKIVVAPAAHGETDTVDLSPLPDLKVALNPSTCQRFAEKAVVDYTATLQGDPGNLPIEYAWVPGDKLLTVPDATLNPLLGAWFGTKDTSATLKTVLGGGYGGIAIPVGVSLYFTDATGQITNDWNGHDISATDYVSIGPVNLCPSPQPSPKS